MKLALTILKIILIVLLILDLLLWVSAYGSGHRIPPKTDLQFGITAFVLICLLAGVWYFGRNRHKANV